jgi:hypothetical protein
MGALRSILFAGVALGAAVTSAAAAPISGSINFTGSDTYSTTTNVVDFVNPATVSSDTIGFTPCVGCGMVAGPTGGVFNYSSAFPAPPAKPLNYVGLLEAMANGNTFSFDLQTITNIVEEANVSLAIEGAGILHLTGFDDTPGSFFFSTQGPEVTEVSFSTTKTAIPIPEPTSWAIFAAGLAAMAVFGVFRRRGGPGAAA